MEDYRDVDLDRKYGGPQEPEEEVGGTSECADLGDGECPWWPLCTSVT